ncbi:MAG: transcriptional regulator [Paracoccus denitrificans]|nr:MAG: transcriptional regulator [Paracoccus denitrificans]PZO82902.1 MAG: transcriptional regulator [Paracoccus denitrificans]
MTTPEQLRAARAMIGISQAELAERVGQSTMTIRRAETSGGPIVAAQTIDAIRSALEKAGVVFLAENGNGPGVAIRKGD